MERAIQLTFNLLLTLVVKLPIIAFFFSKRKRQSAVSISFVINLIVWIIGTILWLKMAESSTVAAPGETKIFDANQIYIRVGSCIIETVCYWYFLGRNWKKAFLLSIVSNLAIYLAAQFISLPEGFFQKKDNMIR